MILIYYYTGEFCCFKIICDGIWSRPGVLNLFHLHTPCIPLELFACLQAIIRIPPGHNLHSLEILVNPMGLKYPRLRNPALDHSAIWAPNLTMSMTRCLISPRHNCHKSWQLVMPKNEALGTLLMHFLKSRNISLVGWSMKFFKN